MDRGEGTYTGETSRSVFDRVGEQFGDLESLEKDSNMVKHWFTKHPTILKSNSRNLTQSRLELDPGNIMNLTRTIYWWFSVSILVF